MKILYDLLKKVFPGNIYVEMYKVLKSNADIIALYLFWSVLLKKINKLIHGDSEIAKYFSNRNSFII